MRYKAVIFDLFGTLVDSFSVSKYSRVLREMAITLNLDPDGFLRIWNETYRERAIGALPDIAANFQLIANRLGGHIDTDKARVAGKMRHDFTTAGLVPRPDGLSTLQRLRDHGLRIGLVSDCSWEVPAQWPFTQMAPLVDATVFSCIEHCVKPDPYMYNTVCSRLGVTPNECLYVGDGGSRELTGAFQMGMTPLCIRASHESTYDPHRVDEDSWNGPVIQSLSEVRAYVVA